MNICWSKPLEIPRSSEVSNQHSSSPPWLSEAQPEQHGAAGRRPRTVWRWREQMQRRRSLPITLSPDMALGVRSTLSVLRGTFLPLHPEQQPRNYSDGHQASMWCYWAANAEEKLQCSTWAVHCSKLSRRLFVWEPSLHSNNVSHREQENLWHPSSGGGRLDWAVLSAVTPPAEIQHGDPPHGRAEEIPKALHRWSLWKSIRGSLQLWRQSLRRGWNRSHPLCLCTSSSAWWLERFQVAEAVFCVGVQGAPVLLLVCRAAVCFASQALAREQTRLL